MEFQTKEEVKQAAAESDEAALLCSIEHYNQMLAASEKELREAMDNDIDMIADAHCALCQRHRSKGSCPMKSNCEGKCFDEWRVFGRASPYTHNLILGLCYHKDGGEPWPEIRAAMGEVRRVLQEKYDELYPRKDQIEKKEKPKFEPIEVHGGCFVVSASVHVLDIKTGPAYNGVHCYQYPREAEKFIEALQSAIDFVEANK